MTLHHTKHHQTYINNLNNALDALNQVLSNGDVLAQVALQPSLKFNAGGHINHSLFWDNLAPASAGLSDPAKVAPTLSKAIESTFGSVQSFKEQFKTLLLAIQGSGWGWLVVEPGNGKLDILQTKDQDLVPSGKVPLLGVDMWEHAYYLQYLNGKPAYVDNIWHVVNWAAVEQRFTGRADWKSWKPPAGKL